MLKKEISPGCSLEGLMLKLNWPPDAERWLIWKDPDAGKDWGQREGDDRGWDGWMASPTQWAWVWVDSRSWWWTGRPGVLWFMGRKESDTTERLNWTELLRKIWGGPGIILPFHSLIFISLFSMFLTLRSHFLWLPDLSPAPCCSNWPLFIMNGLVSVKEDHVQG